jgi:glycerol uptake facilitator-like aquaporin
LIALDGTVSTGVLNPAIAFSLVLYQKIGNWQSQPRLAAPATLSDNSTNLNLNKILSPFLGACLAAALFLW